MKFVGFVCKLLDFSAKFFGFLSEVCWISQRSLLDFSVKFVGFLSDICWISQ